MIKYAQNNEEAITLKLIDDLSVKDTSFVDIGASNGSTISSTAHLVNKGWVGLEIEPDIGKYNALVKYVEAFSKVKTHNGFITPENVIQILSSYNVSKNFGFLNLDIDGYEYFVLDTLLTAYRPSIICVEINENIPPPIKFTVLYDKDHFWKGDHFYGCSIEKLHELCIKHNYIIVCLEYYNAFLIDNTLVHKYPAVSPIQAYNEGYRDRPDRKQQLYWNADVEDMHTLSPTDGINLLNRLFAKYAGKYIIGL